MEEVNGVEMGERAPLILPAYEHRVEVAFGAEWYDDLRNVAPSVGLVGTGDDGQPVPLGALSFVSEDGRRVTYVIQPVMQEWLRATFAPPNPAIEVAGADALPRPAA